MLATSDDEHVDNGRSAGKKPLVDDEEDTKFAKLMQEARALLQDSPLNISKKGAQAVDVDTSIASLRAKLAALSGGTAGPAAARKAAAPAVDDSDSDTIEYRELTNKYQDLVHGSTATKKDDSVTELRARLEATRQLFKKSLEETRTQPSTLAKPTSATVASSIASSSTLMGEAAQARQEIASVTSELASLSATKGQSPSLASRVFNALVLFLVVFAVHSVVTTRPVQDSIQHYWQRVVQEGEFYFEAVKARVPF